MDGIEFRFEEGCKPTVGKLYAIRTSTNREIGSLYIHPYYPSEEGLYLCDFVIFDKRNRNKGIGRAMLRWIKEKYKGTKIYLSCAHGNDNALHLYKSEGFKIYEDGSWYEMACDNC